MNTQPKMGRPNMTDIDWKGLGAREYSRIYQRLFKPRKTSRRWWSGLSNKALGHTEYSRQYRALIPKKPNQRLWTGLRDKQMGHAAYMAAYRSLKSLSSAAKAKPVAGLDTVELSVHGCRRVVALG
jgi:hypothetical protein